MRTRTLALIVTTVVAALLSACASMPSIVPPTVPPPTAIGAEQAPVVVPTAAAAASPLATPAAPMDTPAAIGASTPVTGTSAGAVAIYSTPVITETVPVSPTMSGASETAPERPGNTYRDEIGGFLMDYPADWSVVDVPADVKQQSTNYSITFMSWKPQEPGGHGIPEGGSKIDVNVTKGAATSPEAAVELRRNELAAEGAGSQITFEEPWDLPDGLIGTHLMVRTANGGTLEELVTAINGNRILVSGYGDPNVFAQTAMTLRADVTNRAVLMPGEGTPQAPAASAEAQGGGQGGAQAKEQVVIPMVATGSGTSADAATATVYTVRQGDTLAKIAARFGVTVAAILKANPKIVNPDHIFVGQRITIPSGSTPPPAGTMPVNIYLIGIGGGKTGCGDQVVAVRRDVAKTAAPLTAALNQLLSQKSQYYGESGLYNALYQSNLSIASITRTGTAWTIRLNGTLKLGGVCDNPRVKAQLEQTARQFGTVKSVSYFINGKPLDTLLSGK